MLCRISPDGQNQNEEAEEEGENLDQKDIAGGCQGGHGEIYANVALALAGVVINGEIDREQPAVGFIGNDRSGKRSAGKQILPIRQKSLIESKYGPGGFSRLIIGIRVKNDMTSVFPDLIDIDIGNVIAAFQNGGQPGFALRIAGGIFAICQILLNPFVIKDGGGCIRDPEGHFALLLDDSVPKE